MPWKNDTDVEFIGGPIDGLCVSAGLPLTAFVCVPSLVPRRSGFWSNLVSAWRAKANSRQSVATYERHEDGEYCSYRYLGTQMMALEELQSNSGVSHCELEWLES